MERNESLAHRSMDERLAQADLDKLDQMAADASLDSPPFYNCFINRFAPSAASDSRQTQQSK